MERSEPCLDAVLFDFGGVIAEEGFLGGLKAIAQANGLNPKDFSELAVHVVFSGYVQGRTGEARFWQSLRGQAGIKGTDQELREEILSRFRVRPRVLELADQCRALGMATGILSDQTNWLEELDAQYGVFRHFDHVFNSHAEHMSKREDAFFRHALAVMNVEPGRVAFLDDSRANVARARDLGIKAVLCEDMGHAARELARLCPDLAVFLEPHAHGGLAKIP